MVINVSEALCVDTAEIITVIRPSEGTRVDGRWIRGRESSFKTLASVQFPTGKELQNLPESERTKESILVISVKPILSSSDKDGRSSDIISYKGVRYKVIICRPWDSYGYTYSIGVRD